MEEVVDDVDDSAAEPVEAAEEDDSGGSALPDDVMVELEGPVRSDVCMEEAAAELMIGLPAKKTRFAGKVRPAA